jgi:molybdate transport system substrate-binding protein
LIPGFLNHAGITVFISASAEHLTTLQNKGFILEKSRRNLLKNSIALIVPKDSTAIKSFQDLTKPMETRILFSSNIILNLR